MSGTSSREHHPSLPRSNVPLPPVPRVHEQRDHSPCLPKVCSAAFQHRRLPALVSLRLLRAPLSERESLHWEQPGWPALLWALFALLQRDWEQSEPFARLPVWSSPASRRRPVSVPSVASPLIMLASRSEPNHRPPFTCKSPSNGRLPIVDQRHPRRPLSTVHPCCQRTLLPPCLE